jgi:peroxiredoxin Q/BCP
MNINSIASAAAIAAMLAAAPAQAALSPGATAPDFTTRATLAGKEFDFHLADALKHGPVVLYFYPAAFTTGCTIEAHDFAEATASFAAQHATVIGVSMDKITTLDTFSVTDCRSKFPVASDRSGAISKSYDAVLIGMLGYASSTSYVIAPSGKIIYAYNAMNPSAHVANTMNAVKTWNAAQSPAR